MGGAAKFLPTLTVILGKEEIKGKIIQKGTEEGISLSQANQADRIYSTMLFLSMKF
jgi:hypothetical protein